MVYDAHDANRHFSELAFWCAYLSILDKVATKFAINRYRVKKVCDMDGGLFFSNDAHDANRTSQINLLAFWCACFSIFDKAATKFATSRTRQETDGSRHSTGV